MTNTKLKMKIGEHEIDAEGPAEIVQAQFEAFQQLIATTGAQSKIKDREPAQTQGNSEPTNGDVPVLDKIMKTEDRIVSLTARAATLDDEILLLLLGQRMLRKNESVTGGEIIDGLKRTGHVVSRVDYRLDKMSEGANAAVITIGTGRARRYRLTNAGHIKAWELAHAVAANVA